MLEITQANKDKLKDISILAKEIWEEHFTPIIGEKQVQYMLEKFQSYDALCKQVETENYTYYGLYEQERLIGYMGVSYHKEEAFLSKLYIQREYRGKGYARNAMNYLIRMCKEKQLRSIWLTCNKDNTNTIHAYQKMGFIIFDSVVNDIGEGYVMDDYYMRKTITSISNTI